MDNDSTNFQLTATVQPGSSGGPVLDQAGSLIGGIVARMSDIAALKATNSVPQNVNFGIKAEVAASFLRADNVTPAMSAELKPLPTPSIASNGKAATAQIIRTRRAGTDEGAAAARGGRWPKAPSRATTAARSSRSAA